MSIEEDLANELRQQCSHGEETNPKESAKVLHKLGLVYREKSPDKISLLQSVALMTSALVRQPDNFEAINKDVSNLFLHILKLANAEHQDADLLDETVTEVKQTVAAFRETTKKKLASLGPIDDELNDEDLANQKKLRMKFIRELQGYITEEYTDVMKCIGMHTTAIMGKPPCKFALVGMGSLARKEVTPYSDFEHIIVLEEGMKSAENYQNIFEYFRWFATVFQVILIHLGETILSFLAIPCLNDPFIKENNWFYDKYTPCGISPDGFAPKASKNPLGRQTKTQLKPWITELIKPVSEMVKYLDTEEDLKNGYHLADMLTKTCFVYGDMCVHEEFERKVEEKTGIESTVDEKQKQKVCRYLEEFALLDYKLNGRIDIKRFVYRSSSLFFQVLGNFHLTNSKNLKSCFQIVDKLKAQGKISTAQHEKYTYSMSIACEIRLRAYTDASGQDDIRHISNILGLPSRIEDLEQQIGGNAIVECLSIAAELQEEIMDRYKLGQTLDIIKHDTYQTPLIIAHHLGLNKLAAGMVKKFMKMPELQECETLFLVLCVSILYNSEEYSTCLQLVNENLAIARKSSTKDIACSLELFAGQCLVRLSKFKRALKHFRKANCYAYNGRLVVSQCDIDLNLGECYFYQGKKRRALKYLKRAHDQITKGKIQKSDDHKYNRITQSYRNCLTQLNMNRDAQMVVEKALEQRKGLHVKESDDLPTMFSLIKLGTSLCVQKKFQQAIECFDKAMVCKSFASAFLGQGKFTFFGRKIQCLIHLHKINEASQWVNTHFSLSSLVNVDDVSTEVAISQMATLATKMQKLGDLEPALHHLQQAEQLALLPRSFRREHSLQDRENIRIMKYANRFTLYRRFAKVLYDKSQPKEGLTFARLAFHIVFYANWSPPHPGIQIKGAKTLIIGLFRSGFYQDCLCAAKYAIDVCRLVYDNCFAKGDFSKVVRAYAMCEKKLNIKPTLPYQCSPSIFYNLVK